jgi:hypothetical protein
VARLKNYSHAAVPEASFELITTVQHRLSYDRRRRSHAIVRAMVYLVRKTTPATGTLFHWVGSI